ncbi:unnamed protein product, partial [Mesorhabditis belari]|uniref:7TM GPCR serpentine receptor class x (Srx) domain-containing protein n=1 Tax=Mesorhabditis belari TaxID=2138241 RepID=A0AAF3EN25_9BILA
MSSSSTSSLNQSLLDLGTLHVQDYIIIYTGVVIFFILLVIGLISVNLFLFILFKGRALFAEYAFFTIVWQVIIVNEIHLIAQATTVFPLMIIISTPNSAQFLVIWSTIGIEIIKFTASSHYCLFVGDDSDHRDSGGSSATIALQCRVGDVGGGHCGK